MAPLVDALPGREGGETTRIEVDASCRPALEEFAAMIRGGALRDPVQSRDLLQEMNYYGPRNRRFGSFMVPEGAIRLGERGKRYLGPNGLKEAAQIRRFNQPTEYDTHIDAALTEVSVRYANVEYIGDQVFPRLQVTKPSGLYFIFDSPTWRRDEGEAMARGLSSRAAVVGYTASTGRYLLERYTVEHYIDDMQRDAADQPFDLDALGAELCTEKINLRYEKTVASMVFNTANWPNVALSGTDQWSDYTTPSHPLPKIKTGRLAIRQSLGRGPNTAVMGVEVFETLALHPDLIERVKYTGTQSNPAMVTPSMLAALFMVERILVGGVVENIVPEQFPDVETLAYIWGKKFWLGYVAPSPARETPSAGYGFTKGRKADRYRKEEITSDVIRCEEEFDVQVTARTAGYLLDTVIA